MKKKTLYLIGGIAAAVLVVAVVLVIALGGGKKYETHYDAAEKAFLQQDYKSALKELDAAMEIEATEDCYLLMADVYYAQGDTEMAMQVLYLGYSHVGGEAIPAMLERLQAETDAGTAPVPAGDVIVGGKTLAPDTTSAVLSGLGLDNFDVENLSALTALEELTVSDNEITDITPLEKLQWLTSLQMADNDIADLTPLSSLYALKTLYIDNNPVTDFTPLEKLSALRTLSMKGIRITEDQLAALKKALPNCAIYADTPVKSIPETELGGRTFRVDVTELSLGGAEIDDLTPLAECTALRDLDLRDNKITDISVLAGMKDLERLCLWNNQVSDFSALEELEKLRYLDADTNDIRLLEDLKNCTALEELWLNNNPLETLAGIENLSKLTRLGLKNVGLTDEELPYLTALTGLKELSLEENPELSETAVAALQAALPGCTISHSELIPAEEPAELPAEPDIAPDESYVSVGQDAALNAAGTGTGYAVVWDGTSAAAAGFRKGFLAQSKTLGMNVVGDLWFADAAADMTALAKALQRSGADIVFIAAGDEAFFALWQETNALEYAPKFIQVF